MLCPECEARRIAEGHTTCYPCHLRGIGFTSTSVAGPTARLRSRNARPRSSWIASWVTRRRTRTWRRSSGQVPVPAVERVPARGASLEALARGQLRRRLASVHRPVPRQAELGGAQRAGPPDRQHDLLDDQRAGPGGRGEQPQVRGQRPAPRGCPAGGDHRGGPQLHLADLSLPGGDFRLLAAGLAGSAGHGWVKIGYKFTKPPEEKKVHGHGGRRPRQHRRLRR